MHSPQEKLDAIKKLHGNKETLDILDVKKMLQIGFRNTDRLDENEKKIVKEVNDNIDKSKNSLLDLKNHMLDEPGFKEKVYTYIKNLKTKGKFKGDIIDVHSRLDKLMFGFYVKAETGADIDFDGIVFNEHNKAVIEGINGKNMEIEKNYTKGHFAIKEIDDDSELGKSVTDKNINETNCPEGSIDTGSQCSIKNEGEVDIYANNPNIEDGGNMSRIKTPQEKTLEKLGIKQTTPDNMTPIPVLNEEEKVTLSSTTVMTFEDGNIFLVGKDGEKTLYNKELTIREKEVLKKYQNLAILKEVIEIWSGKAEQVAKSIFWKESRNDDDIILNQVSKIEDIFIAGFSNPESAETDEIIKQIFDAIGVAEDQEAIIGSSDMEKVKSILLGKGDKDTKLKQIFNAMRREGLSGDSVKVKEKVADHLLTDKDFDDVNKILNNPELIGFIENNNKDKLGALIGTELATAILKSYTKISAKQEKHRDDYTEALKEVNAKRLENGQDEISLPDFIKTSTQYSVLHLLKHSLLRSKIAEMGNRGDEKSYTGIYADISGLAENKGWADYFDAQDKNISSIIDVGSTLALSVLSMGVGAIAARAAVLGATRLANTSRAAGALNRLQSSGKLGKFSYEAGKFAGTAGIEGLAFYEGTTITHNLIHGNEGLFANTGNGKEILKSIAFMGALRGVQKLWGVKKISNLTAKVPKGVLRSSTKVAIEAATITGTSIGIEVAFEGEGQWTWQEYLQAIAMVGLFRGAGKLKFSKTSQGIKATFEKGKGLGKKAVEEGKPKVEAAKNKVEKTLERKQRYIHKKTKREYLEDKNGTLIDVKTKKKSKVEAKNLIEKEFYINDIKLKKLQKEMKKPADKDIRKAQNNSMRLDKKLERITGQRIKMIEKRIKRLENQKQNFEGNPQKIELNNKLINSLQKEKLSLSGLYKEAQKTNKIFAESVKNNRRQEKADKKQEKQAKKQEKENKKNEQNKSSLDKTPKGHIAKIFENIKKSPEILKAIDKKLSEVPYLKHLYDIPKGAVYSSKNQSFRYFIKEMGAPVKVIKDFKNAKGVNEHIKNVLFADKDLGYIKGMLKIGTYASVPLAIEELYKFNNVEGHVIKGNGSDVLGDYVSNMYLGVINTMIYEYLNSKIDFLPGE